MTDTRDALLDMQAEAQGYERGLQRAAQEVCSKWASNSMELEAAILALIPADTAPSGMAETTPVADIAPGGVSDLGDA